MTEDELRRELEASRAEVAHLRGSEIENLRKEGAYWKAMAETAEQRRSDWRARGLKAEQRAEAAEAAIARVREEIEIIETQGLDDEAAMSDSEASSDYFEGRRDARIESIRSLRAALDTKSNLAMDQSASTLRERLGWKKLDQKSEDENLAANIDDYAADNE